MNKVPVAATELQQLLRQNTSVFGETTAQKPLSDFVQLKSEMRKKNKLLKVEMEHVPQCPIAGDASDYI